MNRNPIAFEPSTTLLWTEFVGTDNNLDQYDVVAQVYGEKIEMRVQVDTANRTLCYKIPRKVRDLKGTPRDLVEFNLHRELENNLLPRDLTQADNLIS